LQHPARQPKYGWFLTDAAGTGLLAAGQFDAPVPITTPGDGLVLQTNLTVYYDNLVEQAVSTITQ
jgi:hypothetical protein